MGDLRECPNEQKNGQFAALKVHLVCLACQASQRQQSHFSDVETGLQGHAH